MTDPNYTHLLLVVDRSGSMMNIASDMNGGIANLLDEQTKQPGEVRVDAWTFDTEVEKVADGAAPTDPLLRHLVNPRGSTALFDAMGRAITDLGEHLAALPEERRPGKVVVISVTDGQENASKEWTRETVKQLVTQQQETYGWEIVFLGANIDAAAVGAGMGLRANSSRQYTANRAGVAQAFSATSSLLSNYRSGAARSMVYSKDDQEDLDNA